MGRSPRCNANGLKRVPWTPEEDQKLLSYIQKHGHGSWRSLPDKAGLQRFGKSCRLRWINYLRSDIKRGKFSLHEQKTIIQLHALLGNRWSAIASHLPKRTDNEIKNYWNTHIKKKLAMMGIDPATHKPVATATALGSGNGDPKKVSNLTHMAQWESARLEAEARLVRQSSKLRQNDQPQPTPRPRKVASRLDCRPRCLDILKAWQRVQLKSAVVIADDGATLHSPTSTLNLLQKASTANENFMEFEAWDLGLVDIAGVHEDQWIKGFSNLFSDNCETHDLVQCSNGNNGSSNDGVSEACEENNNYYWDDIFNLVDTPDHNV